MTILQAGKEDPHPFLCQRESSYRRHGYTDTLASPIPGDSTYGFAPPSTMNGELDAVRLVFAGAVALVARDIASEARRQENYGDRCQ